MKVKPTLALIIKLNLTSKEQAEMTREEQLDKLMQVSTLNLDWQNIEEIDNLELFSNIKSLFLQYNSISKIENLEFLTSLECLSLEGNQIAYISGLSTLFNLLYLNLANNKIVLLNYKEIPSEISILKIGGNPCTQDLSYRAEAIEYFEQLEELDNISVTKERFALMGIEYVLYSIELAERCEEIKSERTEDIWSERSEETRAESAISLRFENERFMTEDEELQLSKITETVWEAVQKSKKRMEDMQVLREGFREKMNHLK